MQARAIANNDGYSTNALYDEDGSFVRVREVSLTCALPLQRLPLSWVRSASLTLAVRNLALWTRYTGPDPEASNTAAQNVQFDPISGGSIVNNNVRIDYGAVPLARYWVVRLNLGL
jgi:hypothetical protein